MTAHALLLAHGRRRDVLVANKTGRARPGGFLAMMEPESFSVRRRLNNARMIFRHGARLPIGVTDLAVGHAIVGRDALRYVMAVHAVGHFRQRQVGKACARSNPVVARRAVEMILLPILEMLWVRKFYSVVLP